MQMKWTILIRYEGPGAHDELQEIGRFERPPDRATAADFGLSRAEGQTLLANLRGVLTQQQVYAYDERRRHCRHCGRYRRIKDWRPRVVDTALGRVQLRVPRVLSCLCTPEPLDDNDDPIDLRYSECPIESLLPKRKTPELTYLCARQGATLPYRPAALHVQQLNHGARSNHLQTSASYNPLHATQHRPLEPVTFPKSSVTFAEIRNKVRKTRKCGSSALCVTVDVALRFEESQTTMSAARAWTRGVGRLLCSAGAAGGKERAPKRTSAGISPAPPGVVASLRSLAPSHKVRKTRYCFPLR